MVDSSPTVTESPTTDASPASSEGQASVVSTTTPSSDASAAPSTAKPAIQAETRQSLLDVVKKVASRSEPSDNAGQGETPGRVSPAQPSQRATEGEDKTPLGDMTPEEFNSYHWRTQKRMRQFMDENAQLKQEMEPLRGHQKTVTDLQTFLQASDIAKDDFKLLLDLGASIRRGDFKAFLEGVAPYVQLAQESLGISLPADLHAAVQQGHMTEDAARYVAQQRSARQLAEARYQRYEQVTTAQSREQQQAQFQQVVAGAVAQWEQGVKQSDPDYARKEPVVRDLLHAVMRETGPPRSPEHAVEIAQAAYRRANDMLARLRPQPRSTNGVPSSIARVNGARPEPKSLMEAAQQALERTVAR